MSEFEPMRITAQLGCGVVSDATLPIDSILYYIAMRKAHGPQDATEPGGHSGTSPLKVSMPLKLINPGPKWYYAASFAQWSEPVAEMTDYWNKRFDQQYSDIVDFGGRRGKVLVEQGKYRAYHMPMFTRHALTVTWYAVGNIEAITKLLRFMPYIGKKTAQGEGEVLRWTVEKWPHDWSVLKDGKLIRAIPTDDNQNGFYCGFRPSYYMRSNMAYCYIPQNNDAS